MNHVKGRTEYRAALLRCCSNPDRGSSVVGNVDGVIIGVDGANTTFEFAVTVRASTGPVLLVPIDEGLTGSPTSRTRRTPFVQWCCIRPIRPQELSSIRIILPALVGTYEAAVVWEAARKSARGLPDDIARALDSRESFRDATLLIVLPEHRVELEGGGHASLGY